MADAITATWHGNNYQSRFFWIYAMDLLRPETCVSEVTFEANGPKSFDDVVVHYDPPIAKGGANRIQSEYFQVKWHTDADGRFGYEDLIDPQFIGANSISILERLRDAKKDAAPNARFVLVTTYRIKDGDPLSRLVSANDRLVMIERLFDQTTDRSKMGKVRKLWREHLGLPDDDTLMEVVDGLSIYEWHAPQQQLREEINVRANIVGLQPFSASNSDFRYDELARQLKIRKINQLTPESLTRIAKEEGIWVGKAAQADPPLTIAIRSFVGLSTQTVPARPENTLMLNDSFRQRYLHDDRDWQRDIRPRVVKFLKDRTASAHTVRLVMDAHASIAYLSGSELHLKSGKRIELVQKGRIGSTTWVADDGTEGDLLECDVDAVSDRADIALAIAITQPVEKNVQRFVADHLPEVGRTIAFRPSGGPGQQSIAGGAHAAQLAEQIAYRVKELKTDQSDSLIHIFAACPNSVLFFLGQNHSAIGPVIVYEYDFDGEGNRSYQPSFQID